MKDLLTVDLLSTFWVKLTKLPNTKNKKQNVFHSNYFIKSQTRSN